MTRPILNMPYHSLDERANYAFMQAVEKDDAYYSMNESFVVAGWPEAFTPLVQMHHRFDDGSVRAFLKFSDDGLAKVDIHDTSLSVTLAHHTEKRLNDLRKEFVSHLQIIELGDPTSVEVRFWTMGPHSPKTHPRTIHVPTWPEVEQNYDAATHDMVERLVSMKTWNPEVGKLLLWRGVPGLGKTYALRALLREWKDWVEFDYIADPEVFFGHSSDYLLQVLLHQTTEWVETMNDELEAKASNKWRLIILEDAGELLGKNARAETGQALSRLLNTVDGMLGQGLKVLFMVTTNEEIQKLHGAVQRPGRCAINHEFKKLSMDESRQWLENVGHGGKVWKVTGEMTLAELYAISMGIDIKLGEKIGFSA